ncbi:MAG: ABC transporter substrate-binding protein [Halothiobacillaceae bacterium]
MSAFQNPYDPRLKLSGGCSCGKHHSQAEHDAATAADPQPRDEEAALNRAVESAVVRSLFPHDQTRRNFLRAVGVGTAMAAISSFFPMAAARAVAADPVGPLEKKKLKIGFIPITCATPIIMAHPMGFYEREGLDVEVIKTAGWALIRDNVNNNILDASHMLSPMPIAATLGLGSRKNETYVSTIQNINGQAITMHIKHKDNRDPRNWKGMTFGIPFDHSMHNLLLRYYLAEHGVDPDKDVQLNVIAPPEMVANLRAGNIDGFLGPEPFNQRAVFEGAGFIHVLSKDLWDGHPCCAFGATRKFVEENPNTYAALFRAIASATVYAHKPENRAEIIDAIAPANYLNQPVPVLQQVMTGRYADGLGNIVDVPGRADFDPFPWESMGVWILTQMKRWGYIEDEVDYPQIAEQIFLATDARRRLEEMGLPAPETNSTRHVIMGKEFDPARPREYLESFEIRRS